MSSHNRKQFARQRLDNLIRRYAPRSAYVGVSYWQLIHAVRASSSLLAPLPNRGRTDPQDAENIVRACARIARHAANWHRQPELWTAPRANPFVQFRSLVGHLFDKYPVPNFMTPAWLSPFEKPWEIEMYLHLAAGRSIRQFELPVPYPTRLTKRAARFFMQAPDDVEPIGAYRWAQVRSLGGDDRLARLLMICPSLYVPTAYEPFWESVIRFLIANLPICDEEISAIVWFIDQQRFRPAEVVWGPGAGRRPLQPEFTLRGRTLMSLRRHMANWREELRPRVMRDMPIPEPPPADNAWQRTSIGSFLHTDGQTTWTINELLTDRELRVEGGIMEHCVATYIHDCARRRTSIWSLKVQQRARRQRLLTIEVIPETRVIRQAKGRRNADPSPVAKEMLNRWAEQEGLRFSATA